MNLFNDFLNTISDTEVTTTSAIFKLMLSLLLGVSWALSESGKAK